MSHPGAVRGSTLSVVQNFNGTYTDWIYTLYVHCIYIVRRLDLYIVYTLYTDWICTLYIQCIYIALARLPLFLCKDTLHECSLALITLRAASFFAILRR